MPQKKVLFLVPYPLRRAPSQRFRVENFFPLLNEHQIAYKVSSFLDEETYGVLYKNGSSLKKIIGVAKGFLRRFKNTLLDVHHYQYVFIHREAAPIGPPVFEWIIAKLWRKKIIFDFDDAIWIPDSENKLLNWVKAVWKTKNNCKWAYKVSGGNAYLCAFASLYNANVLCMPTCVDMERQHNKVKEPSNSNVTVGWTGSHSTLRYLTPLVPLLKDLAANSSAEILVICNEVPAFSFPGLTFVRWSEKTEIDDLLKIDIGIMPLENDKWSEGKCGFKLIQYLALGIPAVASPVGINKAIIEQNVNGFLCETATQWSEALKALLADASLRKEMGEKGRNKMLAEYSIQSNKGVFLDLFT